MIDTTNIEEPRPRALSRRTKDSPLKTYLWERVPRQLLEDATIKAKSLEPPMSLKYVLIQLLREWTYKAPEVD